MAKFGGLVLLFAGQLDAMEQPTAREQARAAELRIEANRLFSERKFEAARSVLDEGYALTKDPLFIFNRALTHHSEGNCEEARVSYERYLVEAPEGPKRSAALQALQALEPICGSQQERPASAAAPAQPKPPIVPDAPQSTPNLPRGEIRALDIREKTAPAQPSGVLAWSLLGTGAASLLAAGVMGALWHDAGSQHDDLVRGAAAKGDNWDVCCAAIGSDLEATQNRYATLTIGFAVAAVLLGGTGTAVAVSSSGKTDLAMVTYSLRF